MSLAFQQARLVKNTIPALRQHGEKITSILYDDMLREHPELQEHFNPVNLATGCQPRALTSVILQFASNINNISELIPKLERMCNKHCSLGIKPEHYGILGKYLIQAFSKVLGPSMTPEVREAWTKAYWILAKMLCGREMQIYKGFDDWMGWRRFIINKKVAETDDIWSFYLVPQDGKTLPGFLPGQYVSVRVDTPGLGHTQKRQYSLSDSPCRNYYRITVQRDKGKQLDKAPLLSNSRPGLVSNALINDTRVGDILELSHPAGEFFLDTETISRAPMVLISVGIGCSPVISIAKAALETQASTSISYINVCRGSIPLKDDISKLERQHPNFRVMHLDTDHDLADMVIGMLASLDAQANFGTAGDGNSLIGSSSTEYYICGPKWLTQELSIFLLSRGALADRVKIELFETGDARK